jgi:aldose 1-epimerase
MNPRIFGVLDDGTPVHEVIIGRPGGVQATIIEWGAVIRDLVAVRPDGERQRVVLGLASIEDYVHRSPHFGALAGRFANRIRDGRFVLDGVTYELPRNQDGKHTLHGGANGFGKRPWRFVEHDQDSATLALFSPDGDHGFPGNMSVLCRYAIVGATTLRMELTATTDRPTIINLCQHSYFNLDGSPTVLDHFFEVDADYHTPNDGDHIPIGEIRLVEGTPFDFRNPRRVGHEAFKAGFYYDGNFVLNGRRRAPSGRAEVPELVRACRLRSPLNGLGMEIWTTEPGLQVYAGHKLAMAVPGHDGKVYGPHAGLALEPQHFPNGPNLPHFPPTVLRPGSVYAQVTEFRFMSG